MYRNQDIAQPDDLKEILELRPEGARHPAEKPSDLYNRMKGALIGRFAAFRLKCIRSPECRRSHSTAA